MTGASSWRNGYRVSGEQAGAQGLTGANLTQHRYWVSGIEVLAPPSSAVIVVMVDGNTETESDGGRSWPDFLVPRLQGNNATRNRAVVLSNDILRLLNPGQSSVAFNEMVASQTGVRYLMLCPNFSTLAYLGFSSDPNKGFSPEDRIIQALKSAVDQARSRGISTIGCTLPPQKPSVSFRDDEFRDEKGQMRKVDTVRLAINDWMRTSGAFEGLADFDAITRDTANPGDLFGGNSAIQTTLR